MPTILYDIYERIFTGKGLTSTEIDIEAQGDYKRKSFKKIETKAQNHDKMLEAGNGNRKDGGRQKHNNLRHGNAKEMRNDEREWGI